MDYLFVILLNLETNGFMNSLPELTYCKKILSTPISVAVHNLTVENSILEVKYQQDRISSYLQGIYPELIGSSVTYNRLHWFILNRTISKAHCDNLFTIL